MTTKITIPAPPTPEQLSEDFDTIRKEVADIRDAIGVLYDGELNSDDGVAIIEALTSAGNILVKTSVFVAAAVYAIGQAGQLGIF